MHYFHSSTEGDRDSRNLGQEKSYRGLHSSQTVKRFHSCEYVDLTKMGHSGMSGCTERKRFIFKVHIDTNTNKGEPIFMAAPYYCCRDRIYVYLIILIIAFGR